MRDGEANSVVKVKVKHVQEECNQTKRAAGQNKQRASCAEQALYSATPSDKSTETWPPHGQQ